MNPNDDRGDDFMPTDDVPEVNLNLQSLQTVNDLLQMRKNTSFVIEASESEIVSLLTQGLIQETQVVPLTTLLDVYDATKEDRTFHPESPDAPTTWPDQEVDGDAENLASMPENVDDGQESANEDQFGTMTMQEDIDGQSAPILEEDISGDQVEVLQDVNGEQNRGMVDNFNDGQFESVVAENIDGAQTDNANPNVISTSIIVPETIVFQDDFPQNVFQRSATHDSARNSEVRPRGDALLKIDFTTAQAMTTINITQKKTAKTSPQSMIDDLKVNVTGPTSVEGISIPRTSSPIRGKANDVSLGEMNENLPRNNLISFGSDPESPTPNIEMEEMTTRRTNSSTTFGSLRSNNSRESDYIGRRVSTATTEKILSTVSIAPARKSLPAVPEPRSPNDIKWKSSRRSESLEDAPKRPKSGGGHEGRADVETNEADFTSQFSPKNLPDSNRTNAFTTTNGLDFPDSETSTVDEPKTRRNGTHLLPDAAQDFSAIQPVEYVYERATVKLLNKGPKLSSLSNFQNETWLRALSSLAVSPAEGVLSSAMARKPNSTRSAGRRRGEEHNSKRHDTSVAQPSVVRRHTSSPSNHICGQSSTQLPCGKQPSTPAKKSPPRHRVNFGESGFVRRGDVDDESFYGYEGKPKGRNCDKSKVPAGHPDRKHRSHSTMPDGFVIRNCQPSRRIPGRDYSRSQMAMPGRYKHHSRITSSGLNRKPHKGRPKLVSYQSLRDQYQNRYPLSGLGKY